MKIWLSLTVVLAASVIILVSPVKAEEFRLSVTLQEFSGTNVQQRFIEAMRDPKSIASVVETLEPGKVHFSQSLNVTDGRTLDETIVVDNRTVRFHCQLGTLEEGKLMAALDFSMSAKPGVFQVRSDSLQLQIGKKSYVGGLATRDSVRLLIVQLMGLDVTCW